MANNAKSTNRFIQHSLSKLTLYSDENTGSHEIILGREPNKAYVKGDY